jgi:hypothetical protein
MLHPPITRRPQIIFDQLIRLHRMVKSRRGNLAPVAQPGHEIRRAALR